MPCNAAITNMRPCTKPANHSGHHSDSMRPLPDFDDVPEGFVHIYRAENGRLVGNLPANDPSVVSMQGSGKFIVW